jgi:hypothetical protein
MLCSVGSRTTDLMMSPAIRSSSPSRMPRPRLAAVGAIVCLKVLAPQVHEEQDRRNGDGAEDDGEACRLQRLAREVRKVLHEAAIHGAFTIIAEGVRRASVNPLSTPSLTLSRMAVCRGDVAGHAERGTAREGKLAGNV